MKPCELIVFGDFALDGMVAVGFHSMGIGQFFLSVYHQTSYVTENLGGTNPCNYSLTPSQKKNMQS